MPMFRIMCGRCGLSATQILSGGLGVTSVDAEQCALRCDIGREAKLSGDPIAASVGKCPHLLTALAACGREPASDGAPEESCAGLR